MGSDPICPWFLEAENGSRGPFLGPYREANLGVFRVPGHIRRMGPKPLQSTSYCYFTATVGELLPLSPLHSMKSGIFEGCPNEVGYRNSMSESVS